MNYSAIIQAVIFFGYVAYLWKKFGVLHSISQSWYELANINFQNLFWLFSAGVGVPMFCYERFIGDGISVIIFAVSGFFMAGLGIASTFRDSKLVMYLHYLCTLLAIGFALWGIQVEFQDSYYWWFLGACALGCGLIALFVKTNKIWWVELYIFAMIIGRMILN